MADSTKTLTSSSYDGRKNRVVFEQYKDVENNRSRIHWTFYSEGGNSNYYTTGPVTIKVNGTSVYTCAQKGWSSYEFPAAKGSTSGDVYVNHSSDGTKTITVELTTAIYVDQTTTYSASWTLSSIPRASTVTCADGNIGSSTTININRASSNFTHTLTYSFLGLTGTIATKTSNTSIGWTIPTSFYAKIPNAKSGQGTITCQTYSGSTLIGTKTCTFNAFVINSNPTITATVTDTNQDAIDATGDANKLIRYVSNAQVAITATPKNSATISSVKVVNGSQTKTTTTSTINAVDSGTFALSCVDSRGNTGSATVTKTIVNYIKPVIVSAQLTRASTTSNTINAVIQAQVYNGSFGVASNSHALKYRYKLSTASSWSNYVIVTATQSGNNISFSGTLGTDFDYTKSYDFQFVLEDYFMSNTQNVVVTRGLPIVDIGNDDVDVNGEIKKDGQNLFNLIYPIGSIYMSVNSTNPGTLFGGTWVAWGTGRVPVGIDIYQTEFNTSEKTGGTKTHTLTVDEMPSHRHDMPELTDDSSSTRSYGKNTSRAVRTTADSTKAWWGNTGYVGGNQAHNNLQPYITCYMFKRTA